MLKCVLTVLAAKTPALQGPRLCRLAGAVSPAECKFMIWAIAGHIHSYILVSKNQSYISHYVHVIALESCFSNVLSDF